MTGPKPTAKSEAEWQGELSPEQYKVCRLGATEPAFSGPYNTHKVEGTYSCAACGEQLFRSIAKYDSGSGWPSFFVPIEAGKVAEKQDLGLAVARTEISCANCDSHLGHVFADGPPPTGLRYCVNSLALDFAAAGDPKGE